jgi:hypothetical protein
VCLLGAEDRGEGVYMVVLIKKKKLLSYIAHFTLPYCLL